MYLFMKYRQTELKVRWNYFNIGFISFQMDVNTRCANVLLLMIRNKVDPGVTWGLGTQPPSQSKIHIQLLIPSNPWALCIPISTALDPGELGPLRPCLELCSSV